jgi:hypothetical protein
MLSPSATTIFGSFESSLRDDWSLFLSAGTFLNHHEKEFIKKLPIFRTRNFTTRNCETFTDLTEPEIIIEPPEILSDLPPDGIPLAQTLVRCQSNSASSTLALKVGLATMTWQEFILSLLNQTSFSKYNSDQRESLIQWLLPSVSRLYQLPDHVCSALRCLKFVPFAGNQNILEPPMCMFSPSDPMLKNLFLNETKFPDGKYSQEPLLRILKELGLQERPQPHDVINSAKQILLKHSCLSSVDSRIKSDAVVYWLELMATQNALTRDDVEQLLAIPFLKVLKTPLPDDYPKGLIWAGSLPGTSPFASPKDCSPKIFLNLVASSLPLIETGITSDQLQTIFGWNDVPLLHLVQHLKNFSRLDCKTMDRIDRKKVTKMLEEIYRFLSRLAPESLDVAIQHLSTSCWIWNGEGFSSPEEVVIHSAGLSLKPYLFNIPDEFKVFENIFLSANANPTLTADILIKVLQSIKYFHDNAVSLSTLKIMTDLETVILILQWFANRTNDDRILVPIETPGKRLELKPLSDCMYSESVSFFDDFSDEMEGRIFIIHHNVSINLAKALAVPSVTNHVLNA